MDSNEIAIRITNVNKTFMLYEDQKFTLRSLFSSFFRQGKLKKFQPLKDINLEIGKGEFVGIMGKNGSGKSTLLKIIAGIFAPDKGGKVDYLGKLVPFLELGVGFNHDLSGRENIFLNGTILGMSRKFLESKFDEIVDFAEIRDFIDTPVKNYSSGMIVRLAFSIAIQADADIYILDEILSVGDAGFQRKSLAMINEFKKQGKTILFVSHNTGAIAEFCNRAILINESHIIADGDPNEVTRTYNEILIDNINKSSKTTSEKIELSKIDDNANKINYIESLRTIDKNGNDLKVYKKAEKITLRISTVINDLSEQLYLNIKLFDDLRGACLGSFNTYFDDVKWNLNEGKNEIDLIFNENRFIKGKYYLIIDLFAKGSSVNIFDTYNSKIHGKYLEIFGDSPRNGLLILDHQWKDQSGSYEFNLKNFIESEY